MSVTSFVALSFMLFSIGVAGVLTRRNVVVILMSIELILNAVNLNLVAFSRYWQLRGVVPPHAGEVFAIFVIVVAAAETAVGFGVVLALYRNRRTDAADEIDMLEW